MSRPFSPLALLVATVCAYAQTVVPPEQIRDAAKRRHDALVKAGYNMTSGWDLGSRNGKPISMEFFVPESGDEHELCFWVEATSGEPAFRLLGPGGGARVSWSGRKGELSVALRLPSGKYALEIDPTAATAGQILFGVKGGVVRGCDVEPARFTELPAVPSRSFHWPYVLFVPREVKARHLLVVPINTGFHTEDVALLRASASCEVRRQARLAERLGAPLLVPLFPRPLTTTEGENLYLHALSRASLETEVDGLRRVDLQLLGMILDAREHLGTRGVKVDSKVLLWGFSASGSFVNRFAILHPAHVLAVACGSPGGWPIAPVADFEGERLDYPVGIADVPTLTGSAVDMRALKAVSWFFFLGDQDVNDAVPFRDSFSKSDEELVLRRFGSTPASRWKGAERLYGRLGLDARFSLYAGAGHVVTPEMESDIARFFESRLKGE